MTEQPKKKIRRKKVHQPSALSHAGRTFGKLSGKMKGIVLGGILAAIVILAGGLMSWQNYAFNKARTECISSPALEKIISVSELSTFEAVYNGIAAVQNEKKPEKIDYYVSYEARVKAGIDFDEVKIENDMENKRILITLPPVKLTTDNPVDITSMDYIFLNSKANTSSVSQQAYKACIADVNEESKRQTAIYELAQQNAENIVIALIKPFVSQVDSAYTFEIRQGGEA